MDGNKIGSFQELVEVDPLHIKLCKYFIGDIRVGGDSFDAKGVSLGNNTLRDVPESDQIGRASRRERV